jgi:uncharacterized protein (TIGR03435 family)
MLRNLLIDRFQLKFHREMIEKPGFALVVAKKGSFKLHESTAGETQLVVGVKAVPGRPFSFIARKYSMAMLSDLLSGSALDPSGVSLGPVIDHTGLAGDFDIELWWDEDAGLSLSAALQDQLGLRLESQKVQISLFVVDSAQKPDQN